MISARPLFMDFLHLIFPEVCVSCDQILVSGEQWICTDCRMSLPDSLVKQDLKDMADKFAGIVPVRQVHALWKYNKSGKVQGIIRALKYQGQPQLGVLIGRWLGESILTQRDRPDYDYVIPVPLHLRKKNKRGYNQSEMLCQGITEVLGGDLLQDALVRRRNTPTQTNRSRSQRWNNVKGAFEVTQPETFRGSSVLLVDDIVTTGATLSSAVQSVSSCDAKDVSIAVVAIAQ